jgi:hypothetical protein
LSGFKGARVDIRGEPWDNPRVMGLKRWVLTVVILLLVVGLLVGLFFQSGADQRIIASVLPSLENRFGIKVAYRDVDVSLTTVRFDAVEIRPANGARPFARSRSSPSRKRTPRSSWHPWHEVGVPEIPDIS